MTKPSSQGDMNQRVAKLGAVLRACREVYGKTAKKTGMYRNAVANLKALGMNEFDIASLWRLAGK